MSELQKNVLSYTVIYEADPAGGFVVSVPALPGCHTEGNTYEEAEANIKEAIMLYVESLRERNEEVPQEQIILQGKVEVVA